MKTYRLGITFVNIYAGRIKRVNEGIVWISLPSKLPVISSKDCPLICGELLTIYGFATFQFYPWRWPV